jgi:hypothetical protein
MNVKAFKTFGDLAEHFIKELNTILDIPGPL